MVVRGGGIGPWVVVPRLDVDQVSVAGRVLVFMGRNVSGNRRALVKLAKYTKFREEKFGAVLFETRTEKVFTLNPTAAAVVREIQSCPDGDEPVIVERLHRRFRNWDGTIQREVTAFVAELRSKGLIEE
jgi:hypothetical protein